MKLFRYGPVGQEKPGVLFDGRPPFDVAAFGEDYNEAFFANDGVARLSSWCRANASRCLPLPEPVRLGPAIARPSKIVCIGLNYREHARETGATLPEEPVVFMKATSALGGPNDDVVLPRGSRKTDWEVELAVVIGERASYVEKSRAMRHIAGYTLHNDYSEREFQLERGGQWDKGKGADTFAPLGPYLVPPNEVDPSRLRLWLRVNGRVEQDGSTSDMIFDVATLVSYVSQFMTLLPGDVISTGTPAGVGLGQTPPRYLRPGDVVECGIDGLGEARQRIVAPR